MKTLIILRGLPGCGKSTFIKEHGLKDYTIDLDTIRLLFSAPCLDDDGNFVINHRDGSFVWSTALRMLEHRMSNGDFTVIDATHTKTADINKYKNLADKYRYRVYCVDMTDVPVEVAKERNKNRDEIRVVPDFIMEKMIEELSNSTIPSWITVIKPEDFTNFAFLPTDLSEWKKINVIGDIHGCYDVLMTALDGEIKEDEFYIFTGDFLDRGPDNVKTLQFILENYTKENVYLIEGNHENHLRHWANDDTIMSEEFAKVTGPELDAAEISKKEVKKLCRRLCQCMYFTYHGKTFFASHGGISNFKNPLFISSVQLIKGVGSYKDAAVIEKSFLNNCPDIIQIHGHRNLASIPVKANDNCYNLEGGVEFGRYLRTLAITKDGIETFCTHNDKVVNSETMDEKIKENIAAINVDNCEVDELITFLSKNDMIQEKKFGNISSFNFSRKAFAKGAWSSQTVKARGLFIDTSAKKIIARGYEKFFNLNEREETTPDALKKSLTFPVKAYEKENGFLGMLSSYNGKPFFATKSSINGDYCNWFKKVIYNVYGETIVNSIVKYAEEHDCTFVFECIDVNNDPHIIKYNKNTAILLDVISNTNKFEKLSYEELTELANTFDVKVKKLVYTFANWDELNVFINNMLMKPLTYDKNETDIEGYVIEDANKYMFKIKTNYYTYWKHLRSSVDALMAGKFTPDPSYSTFNQIFLNWLYNKCEKGFECNGDNIIALRELYFKEHK